MMPPILKVCPDSLTAGYFLAYDGVMLRPLNGVGSWSSEDEAIDWWVGLTQRDPNEGTFWVLMPGTADEFPSGLEDPGDSGDDQDNKHEDGDTERPFNSHTHSSTQPVTPPPEVPS